MGGSSEPQTRSTSRAAPPRLKTAMIGGIYLIVPAAKRSCPGPWSLELPGGGTLACSPLSAVPRPACKPVQGIAEARGLYRSPTAFAPLPPQTS